MAETKFKQFDMVLIRFYTFQPWAPAVFDKYVDGKPQFFIGRKSYHYPLYREFDETIALTVTE